MPVYMHMGMSVSMYVCMYARTCVCMFALIPMYVCIHVYVYGRGEGEGSYNCDDTFYRKGCCVGAGTLKFREREIRECVENFSRISWLNRVPFVI